MTSGHRHGHDHAHGHGHAHGSGHEDSRGQGHGSGQGDDATLAALLDLDAEVFADFLSEVVGWVSDHAGPGMSGRILDLGCGTGAGTFALLRHAKDAEPDTQADPGSAPEAEVIAVDGSPAMLERLRAKARTLGVEAHVRTVEADLDDTTWPDLGTVDVIWTSAFMHHLADPDRALAKLFDTLRPGGLLAVIEVDGFPRFLPEDLGTGRVGLEDRCHAVVADRNAERLPHLGDDWTARITAAGFVVEEQRTFRTQLAAPLPESARRYAQLSLSRTRGRVEGELSGEDLAVLDALLDETSPESLLHREDLSVRASRIAWAARRP